MYNEIEKIAHYRFDRLTNDTRTPVNYWYLRYSIVCEKRLVLGDIGNESFIGHGLLLTQST